ncbi:MAG: S-methyl-5'-thioadenosine phosphorylase [Planctomycetes bacterium]|nr:S-methyl-5'-thioadenosine phosphorylase [Planctomycetota bacterium]
MSEKRIGVIGGSGLYEMEGIESREEVQVETPFGAPSDSYSICKIAGHEVVFLPRHGQGHCLMPSELHFRANIYGMKKLGVEWIISVSAVGSMKEHIAPRDIVFPDQFLDRTRRRVDTFFGDGVVAHISFSDPVCTDLSGFLSDVAEKSGANVHRGGTYVCIEGPAFSTRAESELYRSWGVEVIGMTNYQEAKLAREAEICYATMACVTDYDCWYEGEEAVTVEMLLENLQQNSAMSQQIIKDAVEQFPTARTCECGSALENAILTAPDDIPEETRRKLDVILQKYI